MREEPSSWYPFSGLNVHGLLFSIENTGAEIGEFAHASAKPVCEFALQANLIEKRGRYLDRKKACGKKKQLKTAKFGKN